MSDDISHAPSQVLPGQELTEQEFMDTVMADAKGYMRSEYLRRPENLERWHMTLRTKINQAESNRYDIQIDINDTTDPVLQAELTRKLLVNRRFHAQILTRVSECKGLMEIARAARHQETISKQRPEKHPAFKNLLSAKNRLEDAVKLAVDALGNGEFEEAENVLLRVLSKNALLDTPEEAEEMLQTLG